MNQDVESGGVKDQVGKDCWVLNIKGIIYQATESELCSNDGRESLKEAWVSILFDLLAVSITTLAQLM